ncbi:phosphoribosylanthranilate isomerase [Gemmatimonas sp.]|jgi:phosphoribosylanthranilate isomerase|uniref:phosphoribosylanthranilate isomerase n=1 Tax=Gemmatimonas sp. TaxID=1962908 RepID=UPI0037BE2BE0
MPLVKICGLTRPDDAAHAEQSGAAFVGVILAGGPRLLSTEQARQVLGPPRPGVRRVAVFGDQPAHEVVTVARALALDVIQLHGDRTPEEAAYIGSVSGRDVWPVLRIAGTELPPNTEALAAVHRTLVLDAHVVGELGGTGVTLDWDGLTEQIRLLRERVPGLTLVLAGGLRPENVGDAIRLLSPVVVDVSSGVENAPGVKDPVRVQLFVQAVRDAAEKSR